MKPKREYGKDRVNVLRIRLTEAERAGLDGAAKSAGRDTSAWARGVLLAAASDAAKSGHPEDQVETPEAPVVPPVGPER